MVSNPGLSGVVSAFASVDAPDPPLCTAAFGCALEERVEGAHRVYAASVPPPGLSGLELRVARTSSLLKARVDPDRQEAWAREVPRLGSPVRVSVVSPQFRPPAHMPKRWAEVYTVDGVTLSFGFEGDRQRPRLTAISQAWA